MYVRFVLPDIDEDSGVREGVFQLVYRLRNDGELQAHEYEELDELLAWFSDHMKVPTRFNRTKSKGWYRRNTKGISWLKATAETHVSQLRRMTQIIEDHGHHVTMIRTSNPGYIVYEDDHQVVAEPFSDQTA